MTCTFCEIVAGTRSAHVVADEPHALAFLDIRPLFLGHTLVVPRRHVQTLPELPPDLVGPLFSTVQRVDRAVVAATGADGSLVLANNIVSQSVPHLHMHVVPRNPKDGLRGFFWPRTKYASGDRAAAVAEQIRATTGSGSGG